MRNQSLQSASYDSGLRRWVCYSQIEAAGIPVRAITGLVCRRRLRYLSALYLIALLLFPVAITRAATPVDTGYQNFNFGSDCDSTPTGEKPESKLWFHDGFWWGSLCRDGTYRIHRLDLATQDWLDTGTALDDRPNAKADILWDESAQKLYVASHIFADIGALQSSPVNWGRLYRYSYNASTKRYRLDSGFPVTITQGWSETLTIDKDTTGKLWVTYVESRNVMLNHSRNGNDADWGTPYVLPVAPATGLRNDDISSLISFSGQIGVMWSNQNTGIMYFATHQDSDLDAQHWQSVSAYNPGGPGADDHIHLKSLQSDDAGRVFAVTKTSFSGSQPGIVLLVCTNTPCTMASNWQAHTVYRAQDNDTRPILLIDQDARKLHVFTGNTGAVGQIDYKSSDLDTVNFPVGEGQPFIKNSNDNDINNPTSTKQNVNSSTGIVVLASSGTTRYYYHNYLSLSESDALRLYLPLIHNP